MRQRSLAFDFPGSRLAQLSLTKKGIASFLLLSALAACGQPAPTSPSSPVVRGSKVPAMPPSSATLGDNLAALQASAGLKSQAVVTTAFCDEFNTFDTARWNTYTTPGYWGFYNTSGTYEAANTTVENGHLVLKLNYVSGDVASTTSPAVYQSAVVQSLDRMGYGTYETWVRSANTSNVPATNGSQVKGTFSLINNHMEYDYADAYTQPDTLIESKYGYGTANDLIFSTYKTNQPTTTTQVTTPQNLSQGFHLQRWEWSPTALKFYVDGVLVHSITDANLIPSEAANVFFNIWPVNKADWSMPGSNATRYTMVDKFCFTPQVAPPADTTEPVKAVIDTSVTAPTLFAGGEASFSAAGSTGEDLTYTWDFGDGSSAVSNPDTAGDATHTYAQPGYYTAKLTVLDTVTNQSSTATIPVAVMPDVHNLPNSRALLYGETLTLDVKYPVAGLSYEWTLGDGRTFIGSRVSPALTTLGFQDITLTIYDDRAGVNAERPVLERRETRVNRVAPHPLADISGQQSGINQVTLDGSRYSKSVTPLTFAWDFGDGQTGAGAVVTHTYATDGRYPITLTVTDTFGRKDSSYQVVILGINPAESPSVQIRADLGSGEIRSQAMQTRTIPREIQAALDKNRFQNKSNVIYLAGRAKASQGAGAVNAQALSAQALTQVIVPFPYVLPRNPLNLESHIIPLDYASYFSPAQSSASLNGVTKARGSGWEYRDCTIDPQRNPAERCAATHINRSFYPTQLQEGINHQVFSFQDGLGQTTAFDTNFAVLDGLRVPHVNLNIIPDTQLEDVEIREYSFDNNGVDEFYIQANVSPSDLITTADGVEYAPIMVPVYAVNAAGQLMTEVSGAFDAFFYAPGLVSQSAEGAMVQGRAEMQVFIPVAAYSDGVTKIDLTQVVMTAPGTECGEHGGYSSVGIYMGGCQTIVASHRTPIDGHTIPAPSLTTQKMIQPLMVPTPPPGWRQRRAAAKAQLMDMVGLGKNDAAREAIDGFLKQYESSIPGLAVSVAPVIGDSADLLVQAYRDATGQQVDYVVATLAVVGLGLDVGTVGIADITAPLKVLYKSGGPVSREIVAALIDSVRTNKSPSAAFSVLKSSASFMMDVGVGTDMRVVEDALRLAKEGKGAPLIALQHFTDTYDALKTNNWWRVSTDPKDVPSVLQRIKIAKYGMFAPATAKAMAKCGSECIQRIGRVSGFFKAKGFTEKQFVDSFERDFNKVALTGKEGISTTGIKKIICPLPARSLSILSVDDCTVLILRDSTDPDPHADALASVIGGVSRKYIEVTDALAKAVKEIDPEFKKTLDREFDVVSDKYIGQAKDTIGSANPGSSWRNQVKATILIAKATGRIPYFQFNKGVTPEERRKIMEYADRYGIIPIIDTQFINY